MKKIFLALILITFLPISTNAEITYPYTIDEKPRILFGDSTPVEVPNEEKTATTTYYGMENYKQEYVNGFARFTFSYTHHQCCYAGYPALIYVTDKDPRTNSVVVKHEDPAYNIFLSGLDFSFLTDVYFYEIQFDETGYRIILKKRGVEMINEHREINGYKTSDWVAIANKFPSFDEGNRVYSLSFTPVKVKDETSTITTINPVIIIPGIMGSAKKNGKLIIDPILHTYDDLIATLDANGYTKEKDLFTFPYEWRDSNTISANLLKDKINQVKQKCASFNEEGLDCSKVDLVAHSMGGLVAREYIQSGQYQNDVDQLIFLGTPHKGSPKAYLQWEGGEFISGISEYLSKQFFISEARRNGYKDLFSYIRNRPIKSVEELLPIFDYIKEKDSGVLRSYPKDYPRNTFLEYINNDTDKLLNSGVKITNMIGNTGQSTIENIITKNTLEPIKWKHGEFDSYELGNGDGTVTTYGSTIDSSIQNEEFGNVSHSNLPRETGARIFNILTNKIANDVIYSSVFERIFSIQLQSPIDMFITAPDGKKIGKNFATSDEYNEIPGAFYSGFNNGDEEYITIPNPLDGEYKIEIQGTGSGKYGVITSYISETSATSIETIGVTENNQITELTLNINNSKTEISKPERVINLDVFINDINGAYKLGWIKDIKTRDLLIKQAKLIIKFEKKRNGKYEEKVDKILLKLLEKELDILLRKEKITKEGYNLIKENLNYLINKN